MWPDSGISSKVYFSLVCDYKNRWMKIPLRADNLREENEYKVMSWMQYPHGNSAHLKLWLLLEE